LSAALKVKIGHLATVILRNNDSEVILTGYSSDVGSRSAAIAIARARAVHVEEFLRVRLSHLQDSKVKIVVRGVISGGATVTANVKGGKVVALLR
jgi:outer membrane protein OmpA-like peptidoglycan-associated protein